MATPIYWVGQDKNVYVKNADGVTNYGQFVGGTDTGFDSGLTSMVANRINDPNVPATPQATAPTAGGGGASTAPKVDPNFVNQAYDTKIAGLQSVYDTLDPQQNAATANVQSQYSNQAQALQGQQAQGHRNLTLAQNSVDSSRVRSLDDLRKQVETQGMSYNNQLGAYGAGDSSAAQMIQQALSGQASHNRADVMQSSADQTQGIQLKGQDLDTEFQNNMRSLDDWKKSSINDIATKFMQQKQAIQQQMVGANADRYQALAAADASYTQRAIQQLANLEGVYKQQAGDLTSQYQKLTTPATGISAANMSYNVNPIDAGQIGQMMAIPQQSSQYSTDPSAYAGKRFEDEYGLSLAGY